MTVRQRWWIDASIVIVGIAVSISSARQTPVYMQPLNLIPFLASVWAVTEGRRLWPPPPVGSVGRVGRFLARGNGRIKGGLQAAQRFNTRSRHYQARRPVVVALVYGTFVGVAWALLFHSLLFGFLYAILSAGLHIYLWRPGGRARRQYEAWCDRLNADGFQPVVFPGGWPPPGWYSNPERRGRVRYWNGAQWV